VAVTLEVDQPVLLLLCLLAIPLLAGRGWRWGRIPSLIIVPKDAASRAIDALLRVLAAMPIVALVLGLAGLHTGAQTTTRVGRGAHVVIVLDRSLSMDEPFAIIGEKARETKTAAAARMLADFSAARRHDSLGLVAFSTAPIIAMPLTDHREPAAAAIAAMHRPGLANTDIGAGLVMGLAQFGSLGLRETRVMLLISDGAGTISARTQEMIRAAARQLDVHLYYLYLRSGGDPPLVENTGGDINMDRPSGLDSFFRSLGVNYAGFEARDPGAVEAVARRIDALESQPILYRETEPRRDLDGLCDAVAAACLLLSLMAHLAERDILLSRRP
jgi:mxaC protein